MQNIDDSFAAHKSNAENWITLASGEFYPDILTDACLLYAPVLAKFEIILKSSHSSVDLYSAIMEVENQWMRTQLCRVFKKYVSPQTPVEMLKRKSDVTKTNATFGVGYRAITLVQQNFKSRPMPDEALCAVLWEYKDRGKKGYDLTERLFAFLRQRFQDYQILGPERAGRDVLMREVFPDYPKADRPVDFVIKDKDKVLAIGLARYDSDRGGAQEDDRTGQYREVATELERYSTEKNIEKIKLILVNDGPGLLLGTMWDDYAYIESRWPKMVRVVTLRMLDSRITDKWIKG